MQAHELVPRPLAIDAFLEFHARYERYKAGEVFQDAEAPMPEAVADLDGLGRNIVESMPRKLVEVYGRLYGHPPRPFRVVDYRGASPEVVYLGHHHSYPDQPDFNRDDFVLAFLVMQLEARGLANNLFMEGLRLEGNYDDLEDRDGFLVYKPTGRTFRQAHQDQRTSVHKQGYFEVLYKLSFRKPFEFIDDADNLELVLRLYDELERDYPVLPLEDVRRDPEIGRRVHETFAPQMLRLQQAVIRIAACMVPTVVVYGTADVLGMCRAVHDKQASLHRQDSSAHGPAKVYVVLAADVTR